MKTKLLHTSFQSLYRRSETAGARAQPRRTRAFSAAAAALVLSVVLAGCRPAGLAYSWMQAHNLDTRLVRTTMVITAGDGSSDARALMNAQSYAGEYDLGRIKVRYPEGCADTAKEVAGAFADTANLVALRTGIEWSFALEIRLVRAPQGMRGFRYSERLTARRALVFPLFIGADGRVKASWAPVVAHEMTEASLIAPIDPRKMALGDLYSGPFCVSLETRWFRDGVADRAGYILGERLFPGDYYPSARGCDQLSRTREALLDWNNCDGAPNYYDAAAALIIEGERAAGEYAISQVMDELANERVHGGRGIRRAFSRATGLDLPGYLRSYEPAWLGIDVTDTRPDRSNPPLVLPGNQTTVSYVYDHSPAVRWKLAVGDVIVSADGVPVASANHFGQLLARHKPGDRMSLVTRRKEESHAMRVKLAEGGQKKHK